MIWTLDPGCYGCYRPSLEPITAAITNVGSQTARLIRGGMRQTHAWMSQTLDWSCDDCWQAFSDVTDTLQQLDAVVTSICSDIVEQVPLE